MDRFDCFRALGVILLICCLIACTSKFQNSQLNIPTTYIISAYQAADERPSISILEVYDA